MFDLQNQLFIFIFLDSLHHRKIWRRVLGMMGFTKLQYLNLYFMKEIIIKWPRIKCFYIKCNLIWLKVYVHTVFLTWTDFSSYNIKSTLFFTIITKVYCNYLLATIWYLLCKIKKSQLDIPLNVSSYKKILYKKACRPAPPSCAVLCCSLEVHDSALAHLHRKWICMFKRYKFWELLSSMLI